MPRLGALEAKETGSKWSDSSFDSDNTIKV